MIPVSEKAVQLLGLIHFQKVKYLESGVQYFLLVHYLCNFFHLKCQILNIQLQTHFSVYSTAVS